MRQLADQVLDELNVKELELIDDDSRLLRLSGAPKPAGPRPEVRQRRRPATARPWPGRQDRSCARRQAPAAASSSTASSCEPDELLVTISGKPGYAAAEEAGYAVAVTTEVTPELADEGLARELVRRIQEMRKNAGFEIADRIRLGYDGDVDVERVMNTPACVSTSARRRCLSRLLPVRTAATPKRWRSTATRCSFRSKGRPRTGAI